jgi:hypothetical protein
MVCGALESKYAALSHAITSFLVGCGLPFSLTEHPLFINMLGQLRPDFLTRLRPSYWFSTQGLRDIYVNTRTKVEQTMSCQHARQFVSLQSTTFRTIGGLTVLNFTERQGLRSSYKDTVGIGDTEQEHTLVSIFAQQLATRPPDKWCSLVIEDTSYLSNVLSLLETNFKGIQCYGCAAYQLEQLADDFSKLVQDTLGDAQFIAAYLLGNRDLHALFQQIQGHFAVKLKMLPENKPLVAPATLRSLMVNQAQLRALMGDKRWNLCTRSGQGTDQSETGRFVSLVGSTEFWERVSRASKLLSPIAACAEVMQSSDARLSHVYVLFNELSQDVSEWGSRMALQAWEKRWKGAGREGGLFHPVHLTAFLLDPFVAIHCENLPPHAMRTVKGVFSQHCRSDGELNDLMEAFYLYHSRGEMYREPFEQCNTHVRAKYEELKRGALAAEGLADFASFSQSAALKCRAAGDPLVWWQLHGHDSRLKAVAIRILSSQPVASSLTLLAAMGRMVQHVPNPDALQRETVKMLLYSNINLQLLNGVPPEAEAMAEEALMDAVVALT